MIKYFIVTKDVAKNGIFSENNGYPSVSTVRSGLVLVRSLTVLTFSVLMTGPCTRS